MEYTNSPLVSYTKLSPYNSGQRTHAIDRITPHCVVGQVTAKELGEWFSGNNRQASSNYGIGLNGEVGMYCPESVRSWCSSSAENDNRAVTIECASDTKHPYAFRDAVYQKLIELCTDICQRNGKTKLLWIENKAQRLAYQPTDTEMVITCHRDFYDTACPGQWMMEHEADLAQKVTAALAGNDTPVAGDINVPGKTEAPEPEPENPVGLQAKDIAVKTYVEVVNTLGQICTEVYQRTGLLASLILAQIITETGYLRNELSIKANNILSLSENLSGNDWPGSTWDGKSVRTINATEYDENGDPYTVTRRFRAYPDVMACIEDYIAYLRGAKREDGTLRYDGIFRCANFDTAAQILKDGPYATAPTYIAALQYYNAIWGLTKWDVPQDEPQEKQDEPQAEPLIPTAQSSDTVTIPASDWNAIKAAIVVAYQAVRKNDDEG